MGVTEETVPEQYFCELCNRRPDVYPGHREGAFDAQDAAADVRVSFCLFGKIHTLSVFHV